MKELNFNETMQVSAGASVTVLTDNNPLVEVAALGGMLLGAIKGAELTAHFLLGIPGLLVGAMIGGLVFKFTAALAVDAYHTVMAA